MKSRLRFHTSVASNQDTIIDRVMFVSNVIGIIVLYPGRGKCICLLVRVGETTSSRDNSGPVRFFHHPSCPRSSSYPVPLYGVGQNLWTTCFLSPSLAGNLEQGQGKSSHICRAREQFVATDLPSNERKSGGGYQNAVKAYIVDCPQGWQGGEICLKRWR